MPSLSRLFVRASLVYLAAGFSLGSLLLVNKALLVNPAIWDLVPVHSEMLLMGWFVQLAVGVAFWILPRSGGNQPRGNITLAWSAFWLINLGILLVIMSVGANQHALLLAGRALELCAVLAFVSTTWKRVRAFSSRGED
jgi:heme/copper-type cytochrome/quinol oxidase subunit 1